MIEIHFTEQEIQDFNEVIVDPSYSEKIKIKLLVIRMRHEEGLYLRVSHLHGNTVTNYLDEFQSGKLPITLEDRYYKPISSLDLFFTCTRCSLQACSVVDAKLTVERIEKLTGIRLSGDNCDAS